jgi:hypothetical protein
MDGTSCTNRTCDLRCRKPALLGPSELTRFCTGTERGLRSHDARAFNAPLYLLSYLGNLIWRLVRECSLRSAFGPHLRCVQRAARVERTRGFRLDRPALWPLS